MSSVDVLVIGAGPAGSSFAYNLKKQNRNASVMLLDKADFPRYKTCGGGISKDVHRYIDFSIDPAVSCELDTISFDLNKQTMSYVMPESLYLVRREDFDNHLVKEAKRAGVNFKPNTKVTNLEFSKTESAWKVTIEGQDPIQANIVILAEGGTGNLAKKLGLDLKLQVVAGLEYEHPVPIKEPKLFVSFDHGSHGYSWNFPKKDGQSFGIGGFIKGKEKKGASLKDVLKQYLKESSIENFDKKYLFGHPIKLYSGKKKLAHQQLLMIGECAGCVDPLTAEGIRPAIKSGFIAAEIVSRALFEEDYRILKEYNEAFHARIGQDYQYARFLSFLFYRCKHKLMPKTKRGVVAFWNVFCGKKQYQDYLNFKRMASYVLKVIF